MFNAERVLGSLLQNITGSRGGGFNKASIGMGLVGLAIAAYENYSKQQNNSMAKSTTASPAYYP